MNDKLCIHCQNQLSESQNEFCCNGCEAAYAIVNQAGFGNYYNLRQIISSQRKIKPEESELIDISQFIQKTESGSYQLSLMVQGLHCAACVWLIEGVLKKQLGVEIPDFFSINFSFQDKNKIMFQNKK